MRVLGKPDLDNAVLFDDLELLLKHYGVEVCGLDASETSNMELGATNHGINDESK